MTDALRESDAEDAWEQLLLTVVLNAAKVGDTRAAQSYAQRLTRPAHRIDALLAMGKLAAAYLDALKVSAPRQCRLPASLTRLRSCTKETRRPQLRR